VLYEMGWRNQRVLDEGLPGWRDKGYPVMGSEARPVEAPHLTT
jgi:3-mercaptopyruvate sulfurtransferase SseA